MKGDRLSTAILVLLVAVLLYLLYTVTGGDWSAWIYTVSEGGTASPLETVTNSLSSLGKAIGDVFSSALR